MLGDGIRKIDLEELMTSDIIDKSDDPKDSAPFSAITKLLLVSRAGFICSHPDCNRITIGSSEDAGKSTLLGEVCHIVAS